MGAAKVPKPQQQKLDKIRAERYNNQWKRSLNLSSCESDWLAVLENENWQKLEQLILNDCLIDDGGLDKLIRMSWPKLNILWINKNNITSRGVATLLSHRAPNIKILSLGSNKIGSKGVKYLVKAQLVHLQQLWLYNCEIGRAGARHLIKGQWPNLSILSIELNHINYCGEEALNENNYRKLKTVYLGKVYSMLLLNLILCPGFLFVAQPDTRNECRNGKKIIDTVLKALEDKLDNKT